jgi:hypothetical protein
MNKFFMKERHPGYFEGWYFKQQNENETVAIIPAFHADDGNKASASLQVITSEQAYNIKFNANSFLADPDKLIIRMGTSVFSKFGCKLNVRSSDCNVHGALRFGPFTSPSYDIMGPFCILPFMECRHSVFSLFHRVDGMLTINGKQFVFEDGSGYIEGDRGTSFPSRYVWTHCMWEGNSIMLSVAQIPFGAFSFIGCIGFILLNGKEYRIATYLRAKLLYISDDTILLRQGKLALRIKLLEANNHLLQAPYKGSMIRRINESLSCAVQYTCSLDGKLLLDYVSNQASFENNWSNAYKRVR